MLLLHIQKFPSLFLYRCVVSAILLKVQKFPRQFPYRCVVIAAAKHAELFKTISLYVGGAVIAAAKHPANSHMNLLTGVLLLLAKHARNFQDN